MTATDKLIGYCLVSMAVGIGMSILFKKYAVGVGIILLPIGIYYISRRAKKIE